MIEEFFVGLIVNGVYHLAQLHREHLKQTQAAKVLSREEIRNSLENGLKSLFPKLTKDFPELAGIDEDQIKSLHKLFYRADGELSDRLRQTITESIDNLSSYKLAGNESSVDMFSVEGFERTLSQLIKDKGLKSLKPETVSVALPRLYFRMLEEVSRHPALSEVVELIRECQKARFRDEVVRQLSEIQKYNKLDDETILNAVNAARQRLKAQATRGYDIKMAGREPNIHDRFDYMPPSMRRVIKKDNQIPDGFEKDTEPIDTEAFHNLFLEKKRVLIIAGAGVGKTTFLYRMQLELMQNRLKEAPLPVFTNVNDFFHDAGTLIDRLVGLLRKTKSVDFSPEKANRIAGILNESGRLCFLLDSLDQCTDDRSCKNHFQMDSSGILEQNRVAVACRIEHIKMNPVLFRDIFSAYEWIILDGFGEDELLSYLNPEIVNWLNYGKLPENFKELLRIPFYANTAKRIGLRPDTERRLVENRGQLLAEFEVELFREARNRGISIHALDESKIKNLLYRLSLDTLTEGNIQIFPFGFIERYEEESPYACRVIFDTQWVHFFSRTIFEGKDKSLCTFYHQLLQEYFAARRLSQLFEKNPEAFDTALMRLPFSSVVLDLLDDLLPHAPVFDHCMDRFETALTQADHDKKGIEDTGHKFTWLLALRDIKGEKPGLKQRLQEIFDTEKEQSPKEAVTDGKFVKIPAGAFLMGGYEFSDEQPVRVVYVSEYRISRYAETFREYDEYCLARNKEKPDDEGWGRGERPVINVSREDVRVYVSWMGKAYSLPTEAQWEKAARGRLGRKYPWGNDEPNNSICNFDLTGRKTVEVQKFEPQMYGIYQMAGNVDEWVEDDWHNNYEGAPTIGRAWIDEPRGVNRVIRGGSWGSGAHSCRSAIRGRGPPGGRDDGIGFRLSRSVTLGP